MARPRLDRFRDPIYIGEAEALADRLYSHEKLARAIALGASELHVHVPAYAGQRSAIEADLRHQHRTPLNFQSVPSGLLGLAALSPRSR